MQVHTNLFQLPSFRNAVVTIGTFDGVHIGHRKIIEQLKEEAAQIDGETVIITFHPHPRKVVRDGQSPVAVLTTLPEKIVLLESLSINHLVVVPFDEAFARQTADEYVQNFLVQKFHPHTVIIGYDHKFGQGRQGDYHLLEKCGRETGFAVKEIPEQILNEVIISSTKIRDALLNRDLETANRFLSYDYFFEGTVVKGKQLGRTINYPTANLEVEDKEKLIPGDGVYTVEVIDMGIESSGMSNQQSWLQTSNLKPQTFQGMMNIGNRPTVEGRSRTIEINLFDFDKDIYGNRLLVVVRHFLRSEIKFSGLDSLQQQLAKDKENAIHFLNI